MGVGLADSLYESGFYSADEIARSSVDDLMQVRGMTEEKALELIDTAQVYIEEKDRFDRADAEKKERDKDLSVSETARTDGESGEITETGSKSDDESVSDNAPGKEIEAEQGTATDGVENDSAEA
jgi:transcription termination/antitermination protein NusA